MGTPARTECNDRHWKLQKLGEWKVGRVWGLTKYWLGTTFTIQVMGIIKAQTSPLHSVSMKETGLYPLNT